MLAPRSRGKGGRRFPGRDGGARRRKAISWKKHANHLTGSLAELNQPVHALKEGGGYGESATDFIYKFDQYAGSHQIAYYAECVGKRHDWTFELWIPDQYAAAVAKFLAFLRKQR